MVIAALFSWVECNKPTPCCLRLRWWRWQWWPWRRFICPEHRVVTYKDIIGELIYNIQSLDELNQHTSITSENTIDNFHVIFTLVSNLIIPHSSYRKMCYHRNYNYITVRKKFKRKALISRSILNFTTIYSKLL